MSADDFCRCTPLEFQAGYKGWAESEHRRQRAEWERTRMECTFILQPWSRRTLKPGDVMQFGWDDSAGSGTDPATDEGENLTAKEIRERFEKVKREMGLL